MGVLREREREREREGEGLCDMNHRCEYTPILCSWLSRALLLKHLVSRPATVTKEGSNH